MRLFNILAGLAIVAVACVSLPFSAEAGPRTYNHPPGFSYKARALARGYSAADPYFYRYEPRGYYPYYNSHYWRPAHEVRKSRRKYVLPPYYKAWGYPKRKYRHGAWHRKHHGRHSLGHW